MTAIATADWVLGFFAAGLLSGVIRRWSGFLLGLYQTSEGGE
jgi:hypothetical protein